MNFNFYKKNTNYIKAPIIASMAKISKTQVHSLGISFI